MAVVNTELLLSVLIEIQQKITFLEQGFKVHSIFIAVDVNETLYSHASAKGKLFLEENNVVADQFLNHCGNKQAINSSNSGTPELGSFIALLEDCDSSNADAINTSDVLIERLGLNLEATNDDTNNEISLLAGENVENFLTKIGEFPYRSNYLLDVITKFKPTNLNLVGDEQADETEIIRGQQNTSKGSELCPYCKVILPTKFDIKRHIYDDHMTQRPYRCCNCVSSYVTEFELQQHEKIHLCKRLYRCGKCSKKFESVGSVKNHKCIVESQSPKSMKNGQDTEKNIESSQLLLCRWCGETFQMSSEHHKHIGEHLKSGFKCLKCDAYFKTWKTLRDHLSLIHADLLPFPCKSCNAAFKTALLLHRHKKDNHCTKDAGDSSIALFSTNSGRSSKQSPSSARNRQVIGKNHLPKEIHLCPSCGRFLDSEKELDRHISQTHKKGGTVSCNMCSKKYKNHDLLDQHRSTSHPESIIKVETTDEERNPLVCAHCKQDFNKAKDLRAHLHMGSCLSTKAESAEIQSDDACKAEALAGLDSSGLVLDSLVESLEQSDIGDVLCIEEETNLKSRSALFMAVKRKKSPWQQKKRQSGTSNLCHICGKNFALPHYLHQHMIGHREWRPFKCQQCGKCFKRRSILREHSALHSELKRFRCKICHKDFHFASVLRQHMVVHSSDRPHVCDVCHRSFKHSGGLRKHRCSGSSSSDTPVPAPHERTQLHKDENMPPVEVGPGDKPKRAIREHDPSRPFACNQCPKRFSLQKALNRHSRVHSEERPFTCQVCSKSFKYASSLKQHHSVHSDERPYKCTCCSKRFKNSTGLREHMDKNIYKCTGCGREYMHKTSLKVHLATCPNPSKALLQVTEADPLPQRDQEDITQHQQLDIINNTYDSTDQISNEEPVGGAEMNLQPIPTQPDSSGPTIILCQQSQPQQQFAAIALSPRILIQAGGMQPQLCLAPPSDVLKVSAISSNQSFMHISNLQEPQVPPNSGQQWFLTQAQLSHLQLPEQQLHQLLQQQFI